jgi:hypothetical protein
MTSNVHTAIMTVRNTDTFNDIDAVRRSLDTLSNVSINWHPDDGPADIKWAVALSEEDIAHLVWIDNMLWDFFNCNPQYDIYDEMMEADIRAHGKASPFYREEDDFQDTPPASSEDNKQMALRIYELAELLELCVKALNVWHSAFTNSQNCWNSA